MNSKPYQHQVIFHKPDSNLIKCKLPRDAVKLKRVLSILAYCFSGEFAFSHELSTNQIVYDNQIYIHNTTLIYTKFDEIRFSYNVHLQSMMV